MRREQKIVVAKCAVGLVALPVLLWAYAAGPYVHRTGVTGTGEKTCNDVGCHVGTPLNGGGGSLKIAAASGTTYTPGQKQTITIQITDAAAHVYGFEMTARLASDRTQQAGTFSAGAGQVVLCAVVQVKDDDFGLDRPASGCPSSQPLEFVEHTSPFRSNTITVDWTPPASAAGAIEIWVSANAANGDGTQNGDHIYNTSITLQPSGGAAKPVTSSDGIVNAGQFGGQKGVAPGTWLEIYGTALSTTTGEWSGGDFKGNVAPTTLGGVTVTIAGKQAFVRFISPGQVNVQAPDGIGTGPVPVVVTNANGSSDPVIVTATDKLPGFLAPFGNGHIAAFQGSTIVGSPGFAPVKPGDTITLYAIGCGTVQPAIPAGQIAGVLNSVTNPLKVLIGQSQASASYQGLGPGFVGLYQFNITVPNVPDGEQPVTLDLGGGGTGQTLTITVKK